MTAAELDRGSHAVDAASPSGFSELLRGWLRRRSVWFIAGSVVFAIAGVELFARPYIFFDMMIYHGAVEWWLAGGEMYDYISPSGLGFTYPPFAAVTMLPMALVSSTAAGWLNAIGSAAALGVVLAVLVMPIAERHGWPRWPTLTVVLVLALAIEPTRETLGFGQVNLLLFALVMADMVALRWAARAAEQRRRARRNSAATWLAPREALRRFWFSGAWAGVGIGLATAVKLTPGLFIVYLLVSRQRRPAMVAMGTAAVASVLTWLVAPRESTTYFTGVLWDTGRVGAADFTPNQSLAGVLARLYDSPETPGLLWLSFAALCCAVGLSRAVSAHKEGDEVASFTLVGLTATVISPISWSHHLVFVVPAIVIMADAALRRRAASRGLVAGSSVLWVYYAAAAAATYIVFLISPIWWVHHRLPLGSHYDSGILGVLAENSLALAVIALVALMPWRPGAAPAHPASMGLWTARRPAVGSSGSTVAVRSRISSPAAPTAGS
jgi:alpha-1,2-mannosyltransferase